MSEPGEPGEPREEVPGRALPRSVARLARGGRGLGAEGGRSIMVCVPAV